MTDRFEIASEFRDLVPEQLGQGVGSGFSIIGTKGKVWSLKHRGQTYYFVDDNDLPLPYIDVVILKENPNVTKVYYPGAYQEGSNNPPTCTAINGDVPDPGVPIPQSDSCKVCRRNVWKVAANGRKEQECKDRKRVAILLMPAMTEKLLGAPLLDPVMLQVPGGSLRSLKAHGDGLIHRGIHSAAVITRISFTQGELFEMSFKIKQPLTNAEAPKIKELLQHQQTRAITGEQTGMREITHQPKREERIETGIMSAFGKQQPAQDVVPNQPRDWNKEAQIPAAKPRGRPPGSVNKPKLVVDTDDEPRLPLAADEAIDRPEEVLPPGQPVPWEEADGELTETLRKVVDQKIQGMLPNK